MSASAHERDDQSKWLLWTGAIATALGLLSSPISLRAAENPLPESYQVRDSPGLCHRRTQARG